MPQGGRAVEDLSPTLVKGIGSAASARYLLRFDDVCPTMNWVVWDAVEACLLRNGVRPIMAVVPDNQDPELQVAPPCVDFWERVRRWQGLGWAIALHGYQHRYVNRNAGMLGITHQSEFAGLPRAEQEAKLRKGLAIFAEHGVVADLWVAPSHSFDRTTVALLRELGVTVISDGLAPWPHMEPDGMLWIPQQLWSLGPKSSGVWTACNHINGWSPERVEALGKQLDRLAEQMTDVPSVIQAYSGRERTMGDRLAGAVRFSWMRFLAAIFGE